jgi:cystathionine beta-lyase/cystathionine gamma-synthase
MFKPLPLGQRIPPSIHGVSCSLPTMQDVIGYEERNPDVLRHLTSGYPRFVLHPLVKQLAECFRRDLGLDDEVVWLTSSARVADELAKELGAGPSTCRSHEGLPVLVHAASAELYQRAKLFLQNTGGFLSSRAAEDHLVARGQLAAAEPERATGQEAREIVTRSLQASFPGADAEDIILAPSGMSAFYAGWRTLAELQRERGRTVWIQLGWLYLDTMAVVRRFAGDANEYVHLPDVYDLAAIESICAQVGDKLAGLITEAPTNPLVQTADLPAVARLIWQQGGKMVVDPTLLSPRNVQVLTASDLVVNSLTKYAANEGDVMAGAVIINRDRPDASYLRTHIRKRSDPIYPRDLQRLAAEVGDMDQLVEQTNRTTLQVARFLETHPAVGEVYWALRPEGRSNYLRVARSESHVGAVLSFTLKGELQRFYDRVRLPKGPSFGMKTTLLCPFIYLAHYDLVTSAEGRAELAAHGIAPELLRLSVGAEPAEEIVAALAEAL